MKKALFVLVLSMSNVVFAASQNIEVHATKNSETGKVYQAIKVSSSHSLSITNTTDHTTKYHCYYNLCAQDQPQCVQKEFDVSLDAGRNFSESMTLEGKVAYVQPGRWWIRAITRVDGNGKVLNSDTSENYVYVNRD